MISSWHSAGVMYDNYSRHPLKPVINFFCVFFADRVGGGGGKPDGGFRYYTHSCAAYKNAALWN